ncbi:hypothetical protein V5O48_006635 [Marasmius crinis-equi]|uniref:Uncharacterized protein n=1 Tax=Marasmius crinis-equi TaxID=585013 RepID=A0ABR3FIZ4_9AGAR
MSYTNPLHTPASSITRSSYSSLGSAMPQPSASASSSTRRRVPQTPVGKSREPPSNAIAFDFVGYPKSGMPLRELHARGPHALQQMMQGASDPVLANMRSRKINFHISWPGYEHVPWCRSIDIITSHGPIMRSHLASIIAHHFAEYIENVQHQGTRNADWRLGRGGFCLDHIMLLSLCHVGEDEWQAEVAIDFR